MPSHTLVRSIGVLAKGRFLDEDSQGESPRSHRSSEHRESNEPLCPRVGLPFVELEPEVDQGAEGGDHGQREDDVIWKTRNAIQLLQQLSAIKLGLH